MEFEETTIKEIDKQLIFINSSFGMKEFKYKLKNRNKYTKQSYTMGIDSRYRGPKRASIRTNCGCVLNFIYMIDKKTNDWYSLPPSEIIVTHDFVIKKNQTALNHLIKNHPSGNPFNIKVINKLKFRNLLIWFEDDKYDYLRFKFVDNYRGNYERINYWTN